MVVLFISSAVVHCLQTAELKLVTTSPQPRVSQFDTEEVGAAGLQAGAAYNRPVHVLGEPCIHNHSYQQLQGQETAMDEVSETNSHIVVETDSSKLEPEAVWQQQQADSGDFADNLRPLHLNQLHLIAHSCCTVEFARRALGTLSIVGRPVDDTETGPGVHTSGSMIGLGLGLGLGQDLLLWGGCNACSGENIVVVVVVVVAVDLVVVAACKLVPGLGALRFGNLGLKLCCLD